MANGWRWEGRWIGWNYGTQPPVPGFINCSRVSYDSGKRVSRGAALTCLFICRWLSISPGMEKYLLQGALDRRRSSFGKWQLANTSRNFGFLEDPSKDHFLCPAT